MVPDKTFLMNKFIIMKYLPPHDNVYEKFLLSLYLPKDACLFDEHTHTHTEDIINYETQILLLTFN